MLALTALGSALAVVPPLAAGPFVVSLTEHANLAGAARWGALIAAASMLSALAYAFSGVTRSTVSAALYERLRTTMLDGVLRARDPSSRQRQGAVARFISDAESLETATVSALDDLTIASLELLWCFGALILLDPISLPTIVILMVMAGLLVRVVQRPLANAGEERQERLEDLSVAVGGAMMRSARRTAAISAIAHTRHADARLGRIEAVTREFAAALADLIPLVVVGIAAARGGLSVGPLLSLLLVSERALSAGAELAHVSIDVESVRGAVSRCFELVDGRWKPTSTMDRSGDTIDAEEVRLVHRA